MAVKSFSAVAAAIAISLGCWAPSASAESPFSWTGFYAGVHGGGQWGSITDHSFDGGDPGPHGALGGVLAGANYQYGPWVFGIEADGGWGSSHGSNVDTGGFLQENDIRFIGNMRGRIGFAMNRTMLFVAGGASWADAQLTHRGGLPSTVSDTNVGWTIGGGVDYAATRNVVLRLEYLHGEYNERTYGFFGGVDPHRIQLDNNDILRAAAIYKW
jgi:outer membrane immunogenic protein